MLTPGTLGLQTKTWLRLGANAQLQDEGRFDPSSLDRNTKVLRPHYPARLKKPLTYAANTEESSDFIFIDGNISWAIALKQH